MKVYWVDNRLVVYPAATLLTLTKANNVWTASCLGMTYTLMEGTTNREAKEKVLPWFHAILEDLIHSPVKHED